MSKRVKEICQKCRADCSFGWSYDDEIKWRQGIVYCRPVVQNPFSGNKMYRLVCSKIDDEPPEYCKYRLEHMIISETKKQNQSGEACQD